VKEERKKERKTNRIEKKRKINGNEMESKTP
jgi:hypothetical protein